MLRTLIIVSLLVLASFGGARADVDPIVLQQVEGLQLPTVMDAGQRVLLHVGVVMGDVGDAAGYDVTMEGNLTA
jgi:hydrogenase maturation factor